MPTTLRFYPRDTVAGAPADVAPAYDAAWTITDKASARFPMSTVRVGGAGRSWANSGFFRGRNLGYQLVSSSGVLPTGVVAGTLRTAWVMGSVLDPPSWATDDKAAIVVKVVSASGATVRGVLFRGDSTTLTTANHQSRTWGGDMTPVTVQAGDRLVVEIGAVVTSSQTNSPRHPYAVSGDPAAQPDTPATNAPLASNSYLPWVELVIADPPAPPNPPTGLAATATPTELAATWVAPASGGVVTGYDVRLDGGPATAVGNVTAHTFAGLTPDTAYLVEVRATGPDGVSAWATLATATPPAPPVPDFRTVVRIGDHTWTANAGDPPALGPVLPVSFGWAVPEDSLGFPAQPDPDTCPLELVTASHTDMAGVDIGTTMRVSLYGPDPVDDRPLATFRGRVADLEAAPHPLGLAWRVLGVGYTADPSGRQVGTGAWPQESGDARAARIMAEAGYPGWTAPTIGTTLEAREPRATDARAALEELTDAAVTTEGTPFGPSRRVLVHPVTDDDGELVAASPFAGAEVLRRVDALDFLDAGLVNRRTSWRRTKLLDATWVRIDHPGGPTTYGDTRGPAYPPLSVPVTDPTELADLILDTTPGYRWLTGQPLRLELWADDGDALAVVSHWFHRDPASPPFPWSGRAVVVSRIAQAPDGTDTYAGLLTAATIRLEHVPGAGGRLAVEFRLRPDIPPESTVTMRWMDEPAGATWAQELAEDPTGTWYDYYTRPRP